MKTKNILYLFFLLSGFISCVPQDTILSGEENYPINPRTIVSAVVYADKDSSFIFLSNSQPLFGNHPLQEFIPLKTAQSVLYKNEVQNTNMYFNPDGKYWYVNEPFHAGDKVEIEVNDNGRKVSAATAIPPKPVILGVDTEFVPVDDFIKYKIRLTVKVKSQLNQPNFYHIYVSKEQEIRYNQNWVNSSGSNSEYEKVIAYEGFSRDDLTWKTGEIIDPTRSGLYYGTIFIFQGYPSSDGENTFVLDVNDFSHGYAYLWAKERLTVNVQAISEDLYSFYSSLQTGSLNAYYYSSLQTGSLNAYSNIQGGLGIFGAVNETEHIVFEKIWQSQE